MTPESITFNGFTYVNVEDINATSFYATRQEDGEAQKPRFKITHASNVISKIVLLTEYSFGCNLFLG